MFYFSAAMVTIFAIWSLIQGIQAYMNGEGFQITPFAIAIVGAMLAGLWYKRARTL